MFPVQSKKGGQVVAALPDVSKVPAPPAPFAPTPYPNMGNAANAEGVTKKVKMGKKESMIEGSKIPSSHGDEAGTLKGIISSTNMDRTTYEGATSKVRVQGAGASAATQPWWAADEAAQTAAVGMYEDEMEFGDVMDEEEEEVQMSVPEEEEEEEEEIQP